MHAGFHSAYWNISARSIKPVAEQQNLPAKLARMPIWLGFVLLLAAWVYPFGPVAIGRTVFSDSIGVAICVPGLLLAIWSRKVLGADWSQDVELKQGHKLVERGPNMFVRHPIYTGHLLMGLGTAIAAGLLVGFAGLAGFVGRVLDKTEAGGTPPYARFPQRISLVQGARQGAPSLFTLIRDTRANSSVAVTRHFTHSQE